MKARNVLWPVVIMSALSLAGACGTDDGGGGGGAPIGGNDGSGDEGGSDTGATNSGGGTQQAGGMSTSDAGETSSGGTSPDAAAGMTGVGGAGIDLCVDLDLDCEDDDNPCTEDECNPATGTCGIPRTGTSCDDGVYCNGDDTCDAGECTEHDGNPCGAQDCNEADDACECTLDEHCPADEPGAWGECDYATTCIETGKRSRIIKTFACTDGQCEQGAMNEEEACTRETDAASCEDDNNRCNGVETCKAGVCKGETNPDWACRNEVNKACVGSSCRECNGTTPCGGDEVCCCNTCHAAGYVCDPKKLCINNPITTGIIISGAMPAPAE